MPWQESQFAAVNLPPLMQAVIAFGIRRNAIGGQIVESCHARAAVATSTSFRRDVRDVYRRIRIFGCEDEVLTVAIHAYWGILDTRFYRVAVDTFVIELGDFFVTFAASIRNFPMIHAGSGIPAGRMIVISVATIAVCGFFASRCNRAAMHALLIRIDWMSYRNFVTREKAGIAVTFRASIGELLAGYN